MMSVYLIAALVGVLATPAFALFMSFAMWQNVFMVLGWKYIARLSILMGVIIPLITALPGGVS